ncbi:MAG: hypothetical protein I4O49_07515 [Janthinobacterium lividum]|nr:hypothetical protein [Janthinobacterium lividum]
MEVFKTLGSFEGHDEGYLQLLDTVMHDGAWWLVATWLALGNTKVSPERIIKLGGPKTSFHEVTGEQYRFVLTNAIPHSLFEGTHHDGYESLIHPAAISAAGPTSIN